MKHTTLIAALLGGATIAGAALPEAARADEALKDRAIGYVLINKAYATWQTPDGKKECPQGFNHGPREQFKELFEGVTDKFAETQLAYEAEIAFPSTAPETRTFFREAQGPMALGLNLDGKVGPNDFISPEGEKGIDHQMYRVVGCTENYRGPDGSARHFIESYMQKFNYNRWLLELTDVDSLADDDDVTVTIYRGLDPLATDAAGQFTSGGTQRVDTRRGKEFIYTMKGKIAEGVLTTTPTDITFPESQQRGFPYQSVHAWRARLKLTPDGASGLMSGYMDVERWYHNLPQQWSTHHRSYGAEPMPSQYRAAVRLADGYPDANGKNTAISTAWEVRFAQALIMHPDEPKTVAGKAAKTDIAR